MKKIPSALILCLTVILITVSCEDDPPQPTKTEMLTSASWKYESGTYNGSAIPNSMVACVIDNTLTFTPATYTVTEGSVVCSPSLATTSPQTWTFQNNETRIQFASPLIPGTSVTTFNVVSLTATNLVLSQDNVVIPPSPTGATLVVTFKH